MAHGKDESARWMATLGMHAFLERRRERVDKPHADADIFGGAERDRLREEAMERIGWTGDGRE